jgi:hypothetical protein
VCGGIVIPPHHLEYVLEKIRKNKKVEKKNKKKREKLYI